MADDYIHIHSKDISDRTGWKKLFRAVRAVQIVVSALCLTFAETL